MNKRKRYLSIFLVLLLLCSAFSALSGVSAETVTAEDSKEQAPIIVKDASYNMEEGEIKIVLSNTDKNDYLIVTHVKNSEGQVIGYNSTQINAGKTYTIIADYEEDTESPVINVSGQYVLTSADKGLASSDGSIFRVEDIKSFEYSDILFEETVTPADAIVNFVNQTGFVKLFTTEWKCLVMIAISCVLMYLAIVKGFEPLLLLPIAFGMLLTNLPGADMFHEELFAEGHAHWNLFDASETVTPGLLDILYLGVKLGIYPCLIFFGVGAMTDFEPLLANPKSLLLGAAAQLGIFVTFVAARLMGFTGLEASSIGIIGGADGPTAIFVTSMLAPHLLGPIAVAAYSYMALVPVIQPPIMKLLTTKKERCIKMQALRKVSKTEKVIFPIVVTVFVALLVPSAGPLVGSLMLGNLFKESGVTERLSKTVQNELMNIVTIFLGVSVGATATGDTFLSLQTLKIIAMGVVAFGLGTAGGVLLAKFMNLFLKNKINPLIGSAGVSAVPMAARVSQVVGQKEDPSNFLLMHAMGPNVAGVIGSAIAAGVLIALFG